MRSSVMIGYARLQPLQVYREEELEVHRATLRQVQAEPVPAFQLPPQFEHGQQEPVSFVDALTALGARVAELMLATAQEGALKRLVDNPDIGKWVEEGVKLHRDHSSEVCEYCAQPVSAERAGALAEHFGASDQLLKAEIESAISEAPALSGALQRLQTPTKQSFYSELWRERDRAVEAFENERSASLKNLVDLETVLTEKLVKRSNA